MARIKIDLPAEFTWETELTVRVTDINYGGHLGNDSVLSLVHEARARWFRALGYSELDVEGLGIVVADAALVYRAEAFFGERLRIRLAPADHNKYGFDLLYRLENAETGDEIARAKTGVVFLDYRQRRVSRVPSGFLAALGLSGPADPA